MRDGGLLDSVRWAARGTFGPPGPATGTEAEGPAAGPPRLLLVLDEAAPLIDDPAAGWVEHVRPAGVGVVLGDNRGLDQIEEDCLYQLAAEGLVRVVKVSLGPTPLLASQLS